MVESLFVAGLFQWAFDVHILVTDGTLGRLCPGYEPNNQSIDGAERNTKGS